MYNKSKNKILFAIFILIILLIISILIISVYNTKKVDMEEYKISPNTIIYDENYNYISVNKSSVLKKEWNDKYYLLLEKNNKHSLGTEPVVYDNSKNQIIVYGSIYQVFSNGDIIKKKEKNVISNVSEFQFFKLNDRKYLIVGDLIKVSNFSTKNYLVISIDKAGNALLINNNVNIKTINPINITVGDIKFDVANEKLVIEDQEIDLKKINGSTNEYVEKEESNKESSENNQENGNKNNSLNNNNNNSNINNSNTPNNDSHVYNDIINQIVNITGALSNQNKTNLYKNISLRKITPGVSYLIVNYSVVDPEEKYLSVFITLTDQQNNITYYYVDKNLSSYRITGLKPNSQYEVKISYILDSSKEPIVADSISVLTNSDPTLVRITKIKNNRDFYYKVKMYNESEFVSGDIALTDCKGTILARQPIDITSSLTANGSTGIFYDVSIENNVSYLCLELSDVIDSSGNVVQNNSYHKIKF